VFLIFISSFYQYIFLLGYWILFSVLLVLFFLFRFCYFHLLSVFIFYLSSGRVRLEIPQDGLGTTAGRDRGLWFGMDNLLSITPVRPSCLLSINQCASLQP